MKIQEKSSPALYPNPVVLVSAKQGDKESIITLSWVGTVCSSPAMVSIAVRPDRYSHQLINSTKEFVINIPTNKQLKQVKLCGSKSGKDIDKWKVCHFTKIESKEVQVPRIKETPVNMECKVKKTLQLGSHDLFIGEVVALYIEGNWKAEKYSDLLTFTRGIYGTVHQIK